MIRHFVRTSTILLSVVRVLIFPSASPVSHYLMRFFSIVFKSAVPVISRPPLPPGGPKVAAIIEPKIEEFKMVHPWVLIGTTFSVEIKYRLTLYSHEGEQIVSSIFMGHGEAPCSPISYSHAPGKATSLAMEEAVEKFMSSFSNLPQVQQWIRQAGGTDSK